MTYSETPWSFGHGILLHKEYFVLWSLWKVSKVCDTRVRGHSKLPRFEDKTLSDTLQHGRRYDVAYTYQRFKGWTHEHGLFITLSEISIITQSRVPPIDIRVTSGIFNGYASSVHDGVLWVITDQNQDAFHIVDQQEIRTKNRCQGWIASLRIQAMMVSEFC